MYRETISIPIPFEEKKQKKIYVCVDGAQVWSADMSFRQMQAMQRMRDRTHRIAVSALVISLLAAAAAVAALLLR